MNKFFLYPFAISGNKTAVPDATQGDGTVSYQQGYGPDYSKNPASDPTAKEIERVKYNELLYDITTAIREIQTIGTPDYITNLQNGGTAFPYAINARVRYDDGSGFKTYVSLNDANTALPSDAAHWSLDLNFSDGNKGAITVSGNGAVFSINSDAVTTVKIIDGAVTANKLATDSVTTAKILAANVTTAKIANNAITTALILDSNVTTSKIADANVTTVKIADNNVTLAKLATQATNTILANATGSTAVPTAVAISANKLIGRPAAGNIGEITFGTNISLTGSTINATGGITGSTDQIAKAWVNFTGTGTVTVNLSYNVGSVTDNGVGDYTINITSALGNANYASVTSVRETGGYCAWLPVKTGTTPTTTACTVHTQQYNGPVLDIDRGYWAAFST